MFLVFCTHDISIVRRLLKRAGPGVCGMWMRKVYGKSLRYQRMGRERGVAQSDIILQIVIEKLLSNIQLKLFDKKLKIDCVRLEVYIRNYTFYSWLNPIPDNSTN